MGFEMTVVETDVNINLSDLYRDQGIQVDV